MRFMFSPYTFFACLHFFSFLNFFVSIIQWCSYCFCIAYENFVYRLLYQLSSIQQLLVESQAIEIDCTLVPIFCETVKIHFPCSLINLTTKFSLSIVSLFLFIFSFFPPSSLCCVHGSTEVEVTTTCTNIIKLRGHQELMVGVTIHVQCQAVVRIKPTCPQLQNNSVSNH